MAYKKPPVNLDNRRVHTSRIALVGVELEGAWAKVPEGIKLVDTVNPGWNELGRDGSLTKGGPNGHGMLDRIDTNKYPILGELPSDPMKESEIGSWLKAHYPDVVGPECGLHVHISLVNPLVYMWLMDDEAYPATVVDYIKKWAEREQVPKDDPIWERLAGNCIFCQHVHAPVEQVKNTTKDYDKSRVGNRYTAVAFHFNRDGLGTIECRLLSMPPEWEQAERAVREFISITNRYLVATAKRERKQVASVIVDQPAYELNMSLSV